MGRQEKILKTYYILTPLFLFMDWVLGLELRIRIPGDSFLLEGVYYGSCFFSSFLFFRSPHAAALFSLVECSVNVLLLVLSIMLPLMTLAESAATTQFHFGGPELLHFCLAAGILLYCFHSNPLVKRTKR